MIGAKLDYDMSLWRPPSEGDNLFIQATIGRSFNRFCSMYRSKEFRALPLAGTLPKDRDALFAALDAARAVELALRPRHLRGHQGPRARRNASMWKRDCSGP